jgi:hypothetical protein
MRSHILIFAVLLVAGRGFAAEQDPALKQLVTRAESARVEEQPALYIEAARLALKSAERAYASAGFDDAQAAVKDLVTYSDRAHDASIQSGKRLKDTEIAMRKMAQKLRDVARTVAFEEQGPLQAAADHLENLRTDLLSHMFAKGKK